MHNSTCTICGHNKSVEEANNTVAQFDITSKLHEWIKLANEDVQHYAREVHQITSKQTCCSITFTLLISFIATFSLVFGLSSPKENIQNIISVTTGVIIQLVGLMLLGRAILSCRQHKLWDHKVIRLLNTLSMIGYIFGYFYLVIHKLQADNPCVSLTTIVNSFRQVSCPWQSQYQCSQAEFGIDSCTYPVLVNTPTLTPVESVSYTEVRLMTTSSINNTMHVTWQMEPISSTNMTVQNVTMIYPGYPLLCNLLSRSFCITPTKLPPYLGTDENNQLIVVQSSSSDIQEFMFSFIWPFITALGYMSILLYRCIRHRCPIRRTCLCNCCICIYPCAYLLCCCCFCDRSPRRVRQT